MDDMFVVVWLFVVEGSRDGFFLLAMYGAQAAVKWMSHHHNNNNNYNNHECCSVGWEASVCVCVGGALKRNCKPPLVTFS
jgi:hypothetical protein